MGINGTEAAQAMGVSQSCYWDWEAGKKSPRISHALNIARVTDGLVPVEVWNDESLVPPPPESDTTERFEVPSDPPSRTGTHS